ncbi:MAG: thioredoxin family protein [Anaerolineales bacterium]|nr:thioredoxin family protein [Anaerolineales bacterium]
MLVLAGLLLFGRVMSGVLEYRNPSRAPDLVRWQEPVAAMEGQADSGKPLLFWFTADWCGPCAQLEREVFRNGKTSELVNARFVAVRVVDREFEEGQNAKEVEELQRRFSVQGFPTLVAVRTADADPMILRGYAGKGRTNEWLESAGREVGSRPE